MTTHHAGNPGPSRRSVLVGSAVAGAVVAAPGVASAADGASRLVGVVQSGSGRGSRRIPHVFVSVFLLGEGPRMRVGHGRTDASGRFDVRRRSVPPGSVLQVVAHVRPGLDLSVVLAPSRQRVVVNELTTVAVGYAFAQLHRGQGLRGRRLPLRIARGMHDNLVDPRTGSASDVLVSSPNGDQTTSLRATHTLANLLATCVRRHGVGLDRFFRLVTPPGGSTPTGTVQALASLARNPGLHVATIYSLATERHVYHRLLDQAPDAWTVVVKVNDTGSDRHLFGGPANLVFDSRGYAWVTNNVVQGTTGSSRFNVVLRPDGRPADGRGGSPRSPLLGGGILGAGFGVAAARDGSVWMGNFGWGQDNPGPGVNGSLSHFAADGTPLSGPKGIQGGPDRVQGLVVDDDDNLWICSFGNDSVYVFPKGNPQDAVVFKEPDKSGPFDVQIAPDGTVWVTNSGGLQSGADSSVATYRLVSGAIEQIWFKAFGHSLKGLSIDSLGNAWIASGGDDCVYLVAPDGTVQGSFAGGGIHHPWSTVVDGEDNVWVANFGPEAPGSDYTHGAVTKLAGANPATRPPGHLAGDPISSDSGYTVPSAGDQVLLADGTPLYGRRHLPSFAPLERVTSVAIDRAGNLWAINNWKPDFTIDVTSNPGGDGICIFVGLAAPR